MDERMDNGTMEVATSLGAVAGGAAAGLLALTIGGPVFGTIGALGGAVVGAMAGRWVGRMIVRPPRARNRSLSEVLDIATQTDARRTVD
jgi:predicted lipid-binding transport protein (Tim44 family)